MKIWVRLVGLMLICTMHSAVGQQVFVNGGFTKDSIAIGEPVRYFLTARYPESVTVLFPDSTFSFGPFEYISRRYYPTRTNMGISYDSVVYQFRTFEIDPKQWLSIPVFIPLANDSLWFAARPDTVDLIRQAKVLPPDTLPVHQLPLKTNTEYQVVQFLFNYPVLVGIVGSFFILSLLAWIIFGKRIKKYIQIRRLQKDYASFVQTFSDYQAKISTQFSSQLAEQSLSLWKKYLEKLDQKPYTKLTTREVLTLDCDPALEQALKTLDGAIYGNLQQATEPLARLGEIAAHRYQKKLATVKHG